MDPEVSLTFAAASAPTWISTFSSTRELRLVYFDGASAALAEKGWLDVQDA
jgi:hypothetical protein